MAKIKIPKVTPEKVRPAVGADKKALTQFVGGLSGVRTNNEGTVIGGYLGETGAIVIVVDPKETKLSSTGKSFIRATTHGGWLNLGMRPGFESKDKECEYALQLTVLSKAD